MSKVDDLAKELVFLTADSRRDITNEVNALIKAVREDELEACEKIVKYCTGRSLEDMVLQAESEGFLP